MRALQIRAWGEPPQVDEVELPVAGPGETLVRVEAAALTHLDLTVAGGNFGIKPDLPYIGGIEGAGQVVQSGSFDVATRVSIRGAGIGLTRSGTWAEYVVVRDRALTVIADGLGAELAAVAHDPLTTAHVALHQVAGFGSWSRAAVESAEDEVVVVSGAAGAVGSVAVQLALRAGARVIALVSRPERAGLVPTGAEVICPADTGRIAELARTRPVTLFLDTVGGEGLSERQRWVRPGGRAAIVGYTAGTSATLDLPNWLLDDVSMLPVNMMQRGKEGNAVAAGLMELLVTGELRLGYQSFPMSAGSDAVRALARGNVDGKAVLIPDFS